MEAASEWRSKHQLYCWGWIRWCSRLESRVLTLDSSLLWGELLDPPNLMLRVEVAIHGGGPIGSMESRDWLPVCFCLRQLDTGRPVDTGASGPLLLLPEPCPDRVWSPGIPRVALMQVILHFPPGTGLLPSDLSLKFFTLTRFENLPCTAGKMSKGFSCGDIWPEEKQPPWL